MPRSNAVESNSNYNLQLSYEELNWLTRVFDIRTLPLAGEFADKRTSSEVQKALDKGRDSLKMRNMIRQVQGHNWQVDPLPAALIRWLGESKWKFTAEVHHKEGKPRQIHAFVEAESQVTMFVTVDENNYSFVLYQDRDTLITALHNWIDDSLPCTSKILSKSPKLDLPSYQVPQPETLIPLAWRDKKLAGEILARVLPDAKSKKATVKWLESLDWVATLSRVNLETENAKVEKRTVLCGTQVGSWSGGGALPHPETLSLSPISLVAARSLIGNLL